MFNKILLAYDGSDGAKLAFEKAAEIAKLTSADFHILAVGRIKEIVVKKGEGFGTTNVMKVTMSCDHRVVDGATGAAFLQTLQGLLEEPLRMLV